MLLGLNEYTQQTTEEDLQDMENSVTKKFTPVEVVDNRVFNRVDNRVGYFFRYL